VQEVQGTPVNRPMSLPSPVLSPTRIGQGTLTVDSEADRLLDLRHSQFGLDRPDPELLGDKGPTGRGGARI
jgi:hypothetical protein